MEITRVRSTRRRRQRTFRPDPATEQATSHQLHLLDRVALRVSVTLMKWGRLPRLRETHERRVICLEQHRALRERERQAEHLRWFALPMR